MAARTITDLQLTGSSRLSPLMREQDPNLEWRRSSQARRANETEAKLELLMADPEMIYNWRRLDDRITTSGQPTEQQLADIRALGVRHIINLGLHTHEKALPDEAASVRRLGMTYIHMVEDFGTLFPETATRFLAINGQRRPTIDMRPGEVQRWRLVGSQYQNNMPYRP